MNSKTHPSALASSRKICQSDAAGQQRADVRSVCYEKGVEMLNQLLEKDAVSLCNDIISLFDANLQ